MKLLTVNIEGHKHVDLICNLLATEQPDVICLQEIFEADLPLFQKALQHEDQFQVLYSPNANVLKQNQYGIAPMGKWGIALIVNRAFIQDSMHDFHQLFYAGEEQVVPEFVGPYSPRRSLLVAQLGVDGQNFAVATTHFTWTPNGQASPQQYNDLKQLKLNLGNYNRFILCGDFNAPRGGEIYAQFAEGLIDHVPRDVLTTLDHTFHYAGMLNLVVDGVLSTPDIGSISTRVIDGVSDHKAIVVEFAV
ncbi:endonuclease/exonuclease/phosphatase family protein [Candidatus Woesebacteria bacterium]|nr:endonuclease/exonuclease/phosphatase family protein [Candidatus Woesebacteria bacterium]